MFFVVVRVGPVTLTVSVSKDGSRENIGENDADVFDFLTQLFGFQRDSVRNQR